MRTLGRAWEETLKVSQVSLLTRPICPSLMQFSRKESAPSLFKTLNNSPNDLVENLFKTFYIERPGAGSVCKLSQVHHNCSNT